VHDCPGFGIANYGSSGNFYIQGLAVLAEAALALTVRAVTGHVFSFISKVHQCGHIVVYSKNDITAATAIAAVRAASRNVLFSMESHGAISAFTCNNAYPGLINKRSCHWLSSNPKIHQLQKQRPDLRLVF
jgi:hypothetical protein